MDRYGEWKFNRLGRIRVAIIRFGIKISENNDAFFQFYKSVKHRNNEQNIKLAKQA